MSKLKPEDRPFSRARAKRWFKRTYPNQKILRHDGNKTFYVKPIIAFLGLSVVMGDMVDDRFGKFHFITPGVARS